jgi:hypothetical protein
MPSLTVSTPYPDAAAGVVDGVLFQTWYRQLGMVSINIGTLRAYAAAQWLAANGRGGTVSWVLPGRIFQWNVLVVAPGIPGSETMDVWFYGSKALQQNTVLTRKGFWSLNLFPALTAYRLSITTRIVGALTGP